MWPRATNPENWLPQSRFIKVISTVRIGRTGGSEIHERVAQLFVVVHIYGHFERHSDRYSVGFSFCPQKVICAVLP